MQTNNLQAPQNIAGQTPLWDKKSTAKFLGISVATIDQWVMRGRGPRHVKLGVLVRFRPEDVQDFVNQRTRETLA